MKKLIIYEYSFFENIRFIIWYNEYMISNIFSKKMRKKRQNLKKIQISIIQKVSI